MNLRSLAFRGWIFASLFAATAILNVPAQDAPEPARSSTSAAAALRARYPALARSELNKATSQIKEEGMERSKAMEVVSYLCDVIGPRLTASAAHKRANEWARGKLSEYGLCDARLEPWGPFGRGWAVKRFSVQVVEPQFMPLIACPLAWSPGLDKPVVGEVFHIDANAENLEETYGGKLKNAIVLISPTREVKPRFEPLATRLNETNLLRLANASPPTSEPRQFGERPSTRPATNTSPTNVTGMATAPRPLRGRERLLNFLTKEGAALAISCSMMGDGGTIFTSWASVPSSGGGESGPARAWATNAPAVVPQATVAVEDYNRLVRAVTQGEKLKIAVEFETQFQSDDLMAYNTVADIPGTDLKDEVVLLGAHLDSCLNGTGATDNAVGVAAMMEAVRIIQALKLQPRRTIRVALWAGEEQGLLGSKAYVSQHYGYYTNVPTADPSDSADSAAGSERKRSSSAGIRKLIKHGAYEQFHVYLNLDNGAGKIRGVHLQGNEAARPIFRTWLDRFRDLGAETIASSNTYGTDHQSFDAIGLPGFQFIQDPLDYGSRTHHSNMDVYDRVPEEDLKQASVIIATFAYNAAMMDERFPRKKEPEGSR